MYEDYQNKVVGAQLGMVAQRKVDITIGENIDQKISETKARLAELEATKERLAETGLLNTRIDDLNRAMQW